jgi:alkylated DNA repair dioxygenase AlkB
MEQLGLLDPGGRSREVLPYGGSAIYFPAAFDRADCARLMNDLISTTEWRQEFVQFYGKRHPIPRQTAWFGDPDAQYTYSKIPNAPSPWTPTLFYIKSRVEELSGTTFNSVLINRYRDGNDSVAWHADDEPELGREPVIGSVSFGATRTMQFRSTSDARETISLPLETGSVLVMRGESQQAWKHQIPKERTIRQERLNLTFRVVGERRISDRSL